MTKSWAFVGDGVNRARQARIFSVTSIPFTSHLDKYLGFPIQKGRQKVRDFDFVIDMVKRRLASWKGKLLNKAGRVTLAKAVLNGIPVYPMQFLWFPQSV